jgi:glycosyltransferase involved in cell wall biosynthesis
MLSAEKLSVAVLNTQPPHLYFGGVERRIIETATRLHDKVGTRIYCGTKKGFKQPTSIHGTPIFPCFSTDIFFPLDNWIFNKTVSRMLDAIKADVFEAHTVSGSGFSRKMWKCGVKKPFVQTVHGVLADEYMASSPKHLPTIRTKLSNIMMWQLAELEAESARHATLIVTVSNYSARKIVQFYNVDEAKIRIVPNGVDAQRFKPIEGSEKFKHNFGIGDKPCVLFVGRLIPRKGLHFLAEAAKHIVKEEKNIIFVVAGEGPLKKSLVAQLKKLNVSKNFVFLGDVQDDVLPQLYNCCDVFVSPAIQEGQGLTLLEAQATAKPVVAFRVGGISESVLNNKTGLLVRPASRELANAVLKLLSGGSLSEKMGRQGREFVRHNFSWDICAEKMFQVYSEALEQKSQG